jgi:NTE family protein
MQRRLMRVLASALAGLALAACTEHAAVSPQPGEEPDFYPPAARPKLALVLSSGGLRGFAHVGVLQALEAHGIKPDLVVGSSVGALVGSLYASGRSAEDLRQIVLANDFRLGADWFRWSAEGSSQTVHGFVANHLRRQRIERFPIDFAAVATDLQGGCMHVFNHGGAAVAVQASTALPGVFAPTPIRGRPFADGGLTSPVPVRVARALGAERVIAVDVTFPPAESRIDGLVDRLFQAGLVMAKSLAMQEAREADLLIAPVLPPQEEIELGNRAALIAAGERATLDALPRIRALLASPASASDAVATDPRRCATGRRLQAAASTG